jgi:PAS domain-containing protein
MADRLQDPGRLAALAASGLLDSPADPAFDRLTHLVARLLGVPVALVSLVDAERQFFKSAHGLPEPLASLRQTPLSHSLCRHVVATDEPLVIDDAREDDRVRDNGAVADLGVIAYAGVPVRDGEGAVFGALSAIESQPRAWTGDDVDVLRELAAVAQAEIELRAVAAESDRGRREAERRFQALVEQVPAVIYLCDFDERLTMRYVSPHLQELTGHPPELWLEGGWEGSIHPEDRRRVIDDVADCVRREQAYEASTACSPPTDGRCRSGSAKPSCAMTRGARWPGRA